MLTQGIYSKEEIAEEFNISAAKAVNVTRKLTQAGYEFRTSGKGATYRIEILKAPGRSIKDFAKEHLGIAARFEDKIAHFLYLLFALGTDEYVNMTPRCLEWITPTSRETMGDWMEALEERGLIKTNNFIEVYYATKKEWLTETQENGDYEYTRISKPITKEEYEASTEAYTKFYQENMKDIDRNPDLAVDEVQYYANQARMKALEGWWGMRKTSGQIEINKKWEHYEELLELLADYEFVNYTKSAIGNVIEEEEALERRVKAWEREKKEKKERLAEEEAERKKEIAEAVEERMQKEKEINNLIDKLAMEGKTEEEIIAYLEGEKIC